MKTFWKVVVRPVLTMPWNGSEDLKLLIVALNNSLKKRVELGSRATAEWLNHEVFCLSGPVARLAACLGATGDLAKECLLKEILPPGFKQALFPYSDSESASKPLVKRRYNADLHLAIGMLRVFNAEENSTEAGGTPQCDFHNPPYMEGAGRLDQYGPLFFEMAETILPKLSPVLGELWDNAKTPDKVAEVMQSQFTR